MTGKFELYKDNVVTSPARNNVIVSVEKNALDAAVDEQPQVLRYQ